MKKGIFISLFSLMALAKPIGVCAEEAYFPALSEPSQQMRVYSSLDIELARPLITAFQEDHPQIAVTYDDLLTGAIHDRIVIESDAGEGTADFVFSSAMDLQVKLANDGYALEVITPDTEHWPDWAMWRETAYALTYEPAVFAYHRPSFAKDAPPATRADLKAWLAQDPEARRGKVGSYDIRQSGVGYLLMARDQDIFPGIWGVVAAMNGAEARYFPTSGAILDRIKSGEIAVGYNLLGSYVADYARRYPDEIGLILPKDFTVVTSRVALVPKEALRPDLGELLLSWLMSAKGQEALSQTLHLPAVSLEVSGRATPSGAMDDLSGLRLKPVTVGPGLLAYLDQATRNQLLSKWARR